MSRQSPDFHKRIARALGATSAFAAGPSGLGTPLDWLALGEEVRTRLRSSGGRPTDPDWDMSRCIRFDKQHWAQLERLAEALGRDGAKVSAGQLAAILLERAIEEAALRMKGDGP